MNAVIRFLNEVTGQVYVLQRKNRLVQGQITKLQRCKPKLDSGDSGYPLLDLADLLRHLNQEQARRETIEEKAKTNVLGITLAFTVTLASLAFAPRVIEEVARNDADWVIWAFMAFQLIGIAFLLLGGSLALTTLRIATTHVWTLEDERSITTPEARNAEISWYLQNNQLVSTLKANLLDASYSCIRNGVTALALSALILLVHTPLAEPANQKPPTSHWNATGYEVSLTPRPELWIAPSDTSLGILLRRR